MRFAIVSTLFIVIILLSNTIAQARIDAVVGCLDKYASEEIRELLAGLKSEKSQDRVKAIYNFQCLYTVRERHGVKKLLARALRDKDPKVREAAAKKLAISSNQEVVPAMLEALNDTNANVRKDMAKALSYYMKVPAVRVKIRSLLNDSSPEVRSAAIFSLSNGPKNEIIPDIINAAKDNSPLVREAASWFLANAKDKRAAEILISLLEDKKQSTRAHAMWGLGALREKAALKLLERIIHTPQDKLRLEALRIYALIGQEKVIPELAKQSGDSEPAVRIAIVRALKNIGSTKAIPVLIKILNDKNPDVREKVLDALAAIDINSVIPILINAFDDEDKKVRRRVADALGNAVDIRVIPALVKAIDDQDMEVRRSVIYSLAKLGNKDIIPLLIRKLQKKDFTPKDAIIRASIELPDDRFLKALLAAPVNLNKYERKYRAKSLGNYDIKMVESEIIKGLKDPYVNVREESIKILKDNISRKYQKLFLEALNDKDRCIREYAIKGLGKIGGTSSIPKLIKLYQSEEKSLQYAIVEALKKFNDKRAKKIVEADLQKSIYKSLGYTNDGDKEEAFRFGCSGMRF